LSLLTHVANKEKKKSWLVLQSVVQGTPHTCNTAHYVESSLHTGTQSLYLPERENFVT